MAYSESDTRSKLIDPRIKESDWLESNIVREYYFTDGRKLIGGKRGKRYFVDYLLAYKNTNLAIIEAKAESKDPLDGLQQSINYAERLRIDYVYSTNGHKIYLPSLAVRLTPPLNIQQKTVNYLDKISKKTEKIKQIQKEKMDSLKALKASILDSAFRGEL